MLLFCALQLRSVQNLPVLMYHHFDTTTSTDTVVSEAMFREQMAALRASGFTSVTLQQVLDFVDNGTPLPEKPVLITMDDGYTSNLTMAAPILEETGMHAVVFPIGVNEGEEVYIHSGQPFWQDRFSFEEAAPWVEKGVIDLQSHTFDMHQLASYGFSGRDGVRRKEGESLSDYRAALQEDFDLYARRRQGRVATELIALAYPFGYYTEESEDLLTENGIRLTFTVEEHTNHLRPGDDRCTHLLGRFNVTDRLSGHELVQKLLNAL